MTPGDEPAHVVYLALTGTPRNRKAMRAVALLLTRVRSALARLGGAPQILVIHAPGADGEGMPWPEDLEVVSSAHMLDASDVGRASDLALSGAADLIDGTYEWPVCSGVHMGLANRSLMQENLFEIHLMRASFRRVLATRPVRGCTIVAGTEGEGAALRDVAAEAGRPVRVVTLPRWISKLSLPSLLRRGSGRDEVDDDAGPGPGRSRLLLVSESHPMAGMYDAIERTLDADGGLSDFVRVQYFLDSGAAGPPRDARHVHWQRPEFASGGSGPTAPRPRRVKEGSDRGGLRRAVDEVVSGIVGHELHVQARHAARVRATLERVAPELVVVGNDRWWVGLTWVLCARSLGIPSLMVQDGVATRHPKWRSWCADRIAVNGRHLGDILEAEGCPPDCVVLVGQPRYDSRPLGASAPTGGAADSGGPPSVLLATQPDQDPRYVETVLEAICAADVEAVLRPHPSTEPDVLAELRELGDRLGARWAAAAPIDELIRQSDVVVVRDSTVALEAALEGTPVITVNLTGAFAAVPYAELGVSREVTDVESLREALAEAVGGRLPSVYSSAEVRRGVEYLVGPCDGDSAARVVAVIRSMLGEPSAPEGVGSGD